MADDVKRINENRSYPTPKDASFWADLGYTLIREIVCSCGHANKVQNEWHTGFFKVECEKCFEELDIHGILHAPDRTSVLLDAIENDTEEETVKRPKTKNPCTEIKMPAPMRDALEEYVKELEERKCRKEKEIQKVKWVDKVDWSSDLSKHSDGELYGEVEWSEEKGRYIPVKRKKNEET